MRSIVGLSAVAVFIVGVLTAGGQAPVSLALPRTADGKPDLSGIWQVLDNSLDGNIEPHAASYGVHGGQGAIVDPPDGRIPYLPSALAKRQENYKNRAKDPVAYCFKPGVPRITTVSASSACNGRVAETSNDAIVVRVVGGSVREEVRVAMLSRTSSLCGLERTVT